MHNAQSAVGLAGLARLVVFIALAAALIVGLFTMHAAGEHSANALALVTTEHPHAEHGSTMTAPSATSSEVCEGSCSSGEHDMAMGACVLALMVLLLFIAPALLRVGVSPVLLQASPTRIQESTAAAAKPPSLEVLSISRR